MTFQIIMYILHMLLYLQAFIFCIQSKCKDFMFNLRRFLIFHSVSSKEIFTPSLSSDLSLSRDLGALPLFMCLQPTTSVYSAHPRDIKSRSFLISMFFIFTSLFHSAQLLWFSCTFHVAHSLHPLGTEKAELSPSVRSC